MRVDTSIGRRRKSAAPVTPECRYGRTAMRAKDLMTGSVVVVRPDTSVKEAAALLTARGFTLLPVVDGSDNLVGVVSEADLIRGRILPDPRALIDDDPPPPAEPPARRVGAVMTANPVVVDTTTDAVAVAKLMLDRHLRALPVTDGDRLVGIITRRDLLRTIARDDRDIARDVRHRLAAACRDPWTVEVVEGVVTLATETPDSGEHHIAQVIAAALPGVVEVRLAGPGRAVSPE
jgi:CBS domain-containing protein